MWSDHKESSRLYNSKGMLALTRGAWLGARLGHKCGGVQCREAARYAGVGVPQTQAAQWPVKCFGTSQTGFGWGSGKLGRCTRKAGELWVGVWAHCLLFLASQEFADSLGIPFLETSAKNATNVEQSFMTMAAEIKKRMGPGATAGGAEKSNVKIQSTPVKQSSGGCC